MQKQFTDIVDEDTRNHYDNFDRFYEGWTGSVNGGYHFGIAKKLSDVFFNSRMVRNTSNLVLDELLRDTSCEKILDAGCGSGDVARILSSRSGGRGVSIQGITLSNRQVEIGQKKNMAQGIKNIELRVGSFENLPFENDAFDGVYFIDSICHGHGEDKKRALQEAARVLKQNGRLAVCDVFLRKSPASQGWFFRFINDHTNATWAVDAWAVEDDFVKTAEFFGLKEIHETDITYRLAPSVLHVPFHYLPVTFFKMLFDFSYAKEVKTLWRVAVFATLLGLQPSFRYKLKVFKRVR